MKEESKDAAGSDQVSLPPPCEYDYAEEQLAAAGEGDPLERPSAVQRQRAKQVERRNAMVHGGGGWWMVWMVVTSGVLIVSRDKREEAIGRDRSTTCRHHFFGFGEGGVLVTMVILVIMKRMLQTEVLPSCQCGRH